MASDALNLLNAYNESIHKRKGVLNWNWAEDAYGLIEAEFSLPARHDDSLNKSIQAYAQIETLSSDRSLLTTFPDGDDDSALSYQGRKKSAEERVREESHRKIVRRQLKEIVGKDVWIWELWAASLYINSESLNDQQDFFLGLSVEYQNKLISTFADVCATFLEKNKINCLQFNVTDDLENYYIMACDNILESRPDAVEYSIAIHEEDDVLFLIKDHMISNDY